MSILVEELEEEPEVSDELGRVPPAPRYRRGFRRGFRRRMKGRAKKLSAIRRRRVRRWSPPPGKHVGAGGAIKAIRTPLRPGLKMPHYPPPRPPVRRRTSKNLLNCKCSCTEMYKKGRKYLGPMRYLS